jgi:hypothetical protein
MKRLLILFGLVFISSACASSFAQTNLKSEFVKLKTGDGLTLHGALWTPGKARVGIIIPPGADSEFYSDWPVWLGENFAPVRLDRPFYEPP